MISATSWSVSPIPTMMPLLVSSGARPGKQLGPHVLGAVEQVQRLAVVAARPHPPVEALGRLDVVIEHVRPCGEHGPQRLLAEAEEVGHQHLDAAARAARRRMARMVAAKWPAPRSGRSSRSTEVTTTWRSPILRTAARRAAAPAARARPRTARGDGAVAAGARADVAHDLEGGGAAAPALADVGAACLLAHGVQAAVAHDLLQLAEAGVGRRRAHLHPAGPLAGELGPRHRASSGSSGRYDLGQRLPR